MSFRYLEQSTIDGLYDAAVKSGLGSPMVLFSLLSGLDPHYALQLQSVALPPQALLLDTLTRLNETERLVDGTVPFELWLRNAVKLAGPRPDAQRFARALAEISRRARGAPAIEDLGGLPERQEQIIHQDDMVPISFFAGGLAASKAVALIRVPRHDDGAPRKLATGEPYLNQGTAWFITPELVVTNHHVVNARQAGEPEASQTDLQLQGSKAWLELDFDDPAMSAAKVSAARLEASDATLDYAILRINGSPQVEPLTVKPARVEVNTPVNIIQHPLGTAKKVACRNNVVTASTDSVLRYFTDTQQGSSGSPVFDDTWRVVALHRASEPVGNVSFQGKATAWVNVGVPIGRIIEHLRSKAPKALWQEIQARQQLV